MATTLTVTAKGQVTLKKDLLEHLGVHPGEQISVDMLPGKRLAIQSIERKGRIEDLFGIFNDPQGPRLSIEEIDAAIAKGWAGER